MAYSRDDWRRNRDSDWYGRPERDWYGRRNWRGERSDSDYPERTYYGDRNYSGRDYGREEWGRDYDGGYDYPGDRAGGWMVPGGAWGSDARWGRDPGWRAGWEPTGYGRAGYGRDRYGERVGYGNDRGWWDRASDEVSSWFGDNDAERRRQDDRRRDERESYYRGKGPRGYTRSDDRIREDVSDRLTDNPILDASEIEVSVLSGEVTVAGSVDSRYSKRLAEDLADEVSGVKHVQNNLRVRETQARRKSISGTYSGIAEGGRTSEMGRMDPSVTPSTTATATKRH